MRVILGPRPRATMTRVSSDLSSRYGAPRAWQRPTLIAVSTLLAAAFLGWLAWATWIHATPPVRSELISFDATRAARVSAVVEVRLAEDAEDAECRLRALAQDHSVVGELVFTPVDGRNEQSFRVERQANSVTLLGCTAKGQQRPQ